MEEPLPDLRNHFSVIRGENFKTARGILVPQIKFQASEASPQTEPLSARSCPAHAFPRSRYRLAL